MDPVDESFDDLRGQQEHQQSPKRGGLGPTIEAKPVPQSPDKQPSPAPQAPKPIVTSKPAPSLPQNDLEQANDEIATLLLASRITVQESSKLQAILRENATLKDKITKLKTLLTRSAKASKETKHELEQHKRLLDVAKKEVERLNDRVEALASRPTHMDLLADFETNFDRALMNLHTGQTAPEVIRQSVGQATEQAVNDDETFSSMLMIELNQTKTRADNLEGVNGALKNRSSQLEKQNEQLIRERESGK